MYEGESNGNTKYFYLFLITDDMVCWSMTHIQMCGHFIHRYAADPFTMSSTAAMPSGVTTGCAWLGRGESVTELMAFMNFPVHRYTCCSDRHASPYWTFIRQWILMGFTPSLLRNRITERCSSLVHVASGAAICTLLLRRRVAFVYPTATCRPLFKPSVSLLSTYRQSSCISNFYHPFKVYIWLSLVLLLLFIFYKTNFLH
jgi:hypothetical protein